MLTLFPRNPDLLRFIARVQFELDGDLAGYARRWTEAPPNPDDPDGLGSAYSVALIAGNYREATWDEWDMWPDLTAMASKPVSDAVWAETILHPPENFSLQNRNERDKCQEYAEQRRDVNQT